MDSNSELNKRIIEFVKTLVGEDFGKTSDANEEAGLIFVDQLNSDSEQQTRNVNQFQSGGNCGVAGTQWFITNTSNRTYVIWIRAVASSGINQSTNDFQVTNTPFGRTALGCDSIGGFPATTVRWFFLSEQAV